MRRAIAWSIVLGISAVALAGCTATPRAVVPTQPTLGLRSLDETLTIGNEHYRVRADFAPGVRDDIEVMTVRVDYVAFSDSGQEKPELDLTVVGADGSPRVEPVGLTGAGTHEFEWRETDASELEPRSEPSARARISQPFSVFAGERGIVISVKKGSEPELRWLAR